MARKPTRAAAPTPAAKPKKQLAPVKAKREAQPKPPPPPPVKKNGAHTNGAAKVTAEKPAGRAPKSLAEARDELMARGADNAVGAVALRSDPLADATAARQVVEFARSHAQELSRRGLFALYADAALALAKEMEDHLQALPATGASVRARSPEAAELISDAAAMVQPARDAVLRVTRGADGRRAAHAFGIGDVYSARQPRHVLRALQQMVKGAAEFPAVAADAGLVGEDLRAMTEMAEELAALAAGNGSVSDEALALHDAHLALRAWFDLVAAKATLAFAGDPEERARLHSLLPRGPERRHSRRVAEVPSA